MKRYVFFLVVAALISGCATQYKPIPDGYTGPTATIEDTKEREGDYKARFFVVTEIDDNQIENGITKARSASSGMGFRLEGGYVTRKVPARPMKVKLIGTHVTGAPIHEMFSRAKGTFFRVEGVVEFTPAAGGEYVVKGELKENGSSVWIEDAKTHQAVTEKIVENR